MHMILLIGALFMIGCGQLHSSQLADRVDPEERRGTLEILSPDDVTLPDCRTSYHSYDNYLVAIRNGSELVQTARVGESTRLPEGEYVLVINETAVRTHVRRGSTTRVRLGRAEVSDVNGTWRVYGSNIYPNYEYALNDLSTGCGVNLAPAHYTLRVTYQTRTVDYSVDLTD